MIASIALRMRSRIPPLITASRVSLQLALCSICPGLGRPYSVVRVISVFDSNSNINRPHTEFVRQRMDNERLRLQMVSEENAANFTQKFLTTRQSTSAKD
jgi:hypothetical protein